jgi:hypothetical protein
VTAFGGRARGRSYASRAVDTVSRRREIGAGGGSTIAGSSAGRSQAGGGPFAWPQRRPGSLTTASRSAPVLAEGGDSRPVAWLIGVEQAIAA